jgi:hypothetical protein
MQNQQGTPFPQLSASPKSLALIGAIQTVFLELMEEQKRNHGGPPSKSLFDVSYIMINLHVMGQDYDTYWKAFQRAQRDYGYTSTVWNKAFRAKEEIDQKVILNSWGADPEILVVLQRMAIFATELGKEDSSWEPMDLIIWSILTSMVDPDYHEPLLRDLVRIIEEFVEKEEEDKSILN